MECAQDSHNDTTHDSITQNEFSHIDAMLVNLLLGEDEENGNCSTADDDMHVRTCINNNVNVNAACTLDDRTYNTISIDKCLPLLAFHDLGLLQSRLFNFLTADDVMALRLVCRSINEMASCDFVWAKKLSNLWDNKVKTDTYRHIQQVLSEANDTSTTCFAAYIDSIRDSGRQYITEEELVSLPWHFRWKESAGATWIREDPWWDIQSIDSIYQDNLENDLDDDELHQRIGIKTISFSRNGSIFETQGSIQYPDLDNHDLSLIETGAWDFVMDSLDFAPTQTVGSYVQVVIGRQELPTFLVRRSPNNNWGFIMENCWGVYMSFPIPARGECVELEDNALLVKYEHQFREALLHNQTGTPMMRNLTEKDVKDFDNYQRRQYVPRSMLVCNKRSSSEGIFTKCKLDQILVQSFVNDPFCRFDSRKGIW